MCKYIEYNKNHRFSELTVSHVNHNDFVLWEVLSNTEVKYILYTKRRYYYLDGVGDVLFGDEKLRDYKIGESIKFSNFKDTVYPKVKVERTLYN